MKKVMIFYLMFFSFFHLFAQEKTSTPIKLELKKALLLKSLREIQPSGLVIWKDKLLTVDDKSDDVIFEILWKNGYSEIRPFLFFQVPPHNLPKLDLEGITRWGDKLYLASETDCRILEVSSDGKGQWLPLEIKKKGLEKGLFVKHNAGIEGITALGKGHFLLTGEREPRGLMEVRLEPESYECQLMPREMGLDPDVNPDFAGLYHYQGKTWALFRNAHQIVELTGKIGHYRVAKRYDFSDVILSSKYRYIDMTFGIAEGLAVDEDNFYVIVDNNNMERAEAPGDRRPLFLVLSRPK